MQTETTMIWAASIFAGFLLFRILSRRQSQNPASAADFDSEMDHILTDDKYKVKGRFE